GGDHVGAHQLACQLLELWSAPCGEDEADAFLVQTPGDHRAQARRRACYEGTGTGQVTHARSLGPGPTGPLPPLCRVLPRLRGGEMPHAPLPRLCRVLPRLRGGELIRPTPLLWPFPRTPPRTRTQAHPGRVSPPAG